MTNTRPRHTSTLSMQSPGSEDYFGIRSTIDSDNDDMFVRGNSQEATTAFQSGTLAKANNDSGCSNPRESQDQTEETQSKISSLMIVFNTWNAMIGCGTVTIPWAFQQSGVLLGVLITAIACIFAFTTNYLILRVAGKDTNFSDTMHHYFPTWGWPISMACFIINFYVGIILFFQVLSQSLYPILLFAMGKDVAIEMTTDWSQFSLSYTCLILLGIVLIMTASRNTTFIQRVNAFGIVFVVIFISFVLYQGIASMTSTNFVYSKAAYEDALATSPETYTAYLPLWGSQFTPLMGILGGGFYFHNMSLSMIANAEKPEHNTRNIFIGFLLVFFTYSMIGVTGAYGFLGSSFAEFSPSVNMIKENCLNMFASDDKMATFIRACILCQLLCVNTLLFGLLRSQILLLYTGIKDGIEAVSSGESEIKLTRCKNFLLSFAMCIPPISLAIWYPYVGKLGALIAAFSTMFVIYILPLATYAKAVWVQQNGAEKINEESEDQKRNDFEDQEPQRFDINSESMLQGLRFTKLDFGESTQQEELLRKPKQAAKKHQLTAWSFRKVALGSTALASYGITVFVIQLFYLAKSMQQTV